MTAIKDTHLIIRISEGLKKDLKKTADDLDLSVAAYVRMLIKKEVNKRSKK
jgi:antitoxin component of RelBE/YafQ-DinJ toxin-antitoxin module